jgi:hypothetical protein
MVGRMSMVQNARDERAPAGMRPGYRAMQALRIPPSKPVPLDSRNGVFPGRRVGSGPAGTSESNGPGSV